MTLASAMASAVHAQLEKSARRFHNLRRDDRAAEHRYWDFERCPAASCAEARQALGIPAPDPLPELLLDRDPGAEG